ncbi:MAG: hypothetical protein A3G05_00865 [Candidatus Zambryskibacteria bacterium RIFCSPLOWO2_12_FULL_45_14]|uniref:Ig-like domain-containing protein n=2 Tax=Candidatus Zambryskiibacteriota TaxID=1817925 RepID=A0A1G2UK92_9BACT|nr:MAG: hypothetical protein A3H60_00500 [Candidatus Zambryskibacteria bacterium RIFCSPLOWO2_02_FULL_44_12b]OHB13968.1 MAG: hypothetical protein A3G05_00865 [Candidatus Zambryskibacteria bacterium RIFCSPLOWO2_12_FULL_45_14]
MKKWLVLVFISYFLLPTTISAQEIDLLWQGGTYVPPFYKGLPLWSKQSKITFVAIPQGLGNPANLNYKWTKNGTVLGNISGVGKNSISFFDPVISRPQTIVVEIVTNEDDVLASAVLTVVSTPPVLVVYENNPLYGFMFHRETSGVHELQGQEVTFTAFPLFFSAVGRMDSFLEYKWQTNVGEAEARNSVTYRSPDDVSGSSEVQASIVNTKRILQDARNSFLIKFGNNE